MIDDQEQSQIKGCNTEICPLNTDELEECVCPNGTFLCDSCEVPSTYSYTCQRLETDDTNMGCVDDRVGECGAAGDPHINTFDGVNIDVYGVGTYLFIRFKVT